MASLATIARVIAREGARWNLVPRILAHENRVQVCEMVSELSPSSAIKRPVRVARVVCSLTPESGMDAWSAVLLHRLKREHHDFMRLVRAGDEKRRAVEQALVEQRGRDLRRKLETLARRRVITTGIAR